MLDKLESILQSVAKMNWLRDEYFRIARSSGSASSLMMDDFFTCLGEYVTNELKPFYTLAEGYPRREYFRVQLEKPDLLETEVLYYDAGFSFDLIYSSLDQSFRLNIDFYARKMYKPEHLKAMEDSVSAYESYVIKLADFSGEQIHALVELAKVKVGLLVKSWV